MREEKNQVNQAEPMVAFVACAGCAAGKKRFADSGISCAEAVAAGFDRGECKNGCVGAGSCIAVCKKGAMSIQDGKVVTIVKNVMDAEIVQRRVYVLSI